ncbi:MAG: tetratricopeptide repeat protein [Ignavibacteriales bacterium]|nr:tetratricopeptide repeat protein [Ignavibacteriales bacterium]
MSLAIQRGSKWMGHITLVALVAAGMSLMGCGGSEEATQMEGESEDQQLSGEQKLDTGEEKKDENPYGQALTSFLGEEKKAEPAAQQAPPSVQPTASATYEKQIEDLRTENTTLKQRIVKLEQDNRTLNARLSDTEAQLTSEKERADRAEMAAKSMPVMTQPTMPGGGTKSSEVKSMPPMEVSNYEDALKAFNARQYDTALKGFQTILDGGVLENWADNCKYWIGESHYARKRYSEAAKSFEEVLGYKNSEKKADAQFMMAQAYERMGKKAEAKAAYEVVVKDYPTSRNVKKAKARWAKL